MPWGILLSTLAYGATMTAVLIGLLRGRGWLVRGTVSLIALAGLMAIWLVGERTLFWFVPITLVAAFLIAALVLLCHRWLARGFALLLALGALVAIRLVGDHLERTDWQNVGGYVDCWPACSRWHLLGALMHFGPAIVALVLIAVVSTTAIAERRRLSLRAGGS